MPGRLVPLVTGEIYHVFNRGIDRRPLFFDRREYQRCRDVVNFYRFRKPPVKYSQFHIWNQKQRDHVLKEIETAGDTLIDIVAYCFMPNHVHFLLRQQVDGGISRFMSMVQNSYTRYFNTRHKRVGPLLLDQFKAVRIEDEAQLLHVARYIHLNPYTSYIVKTIEEVETYRWSSFMEYADTKGGFCCTEILLGLFKDKHLFVSSTLDQADYQRQLGTIKHLALDQDKFLRCCS